MRNGTERRRAKRLGAVICAVLMAGLVLLTAVGMLLVWRGVAVEAAETVSVLISAALLLAIAAGVTAALIQRLREIRKGEEDEAAQY